MGRSSLIPFGATALVVAVFAASSCSQDPSNVVITQPDGGPICDLAARGCLPGQACLNSICAARCAAGVACPAGTYCEGDAGIDEVCAPVEAIACVSFQQCPAPQGCGLGLCTSAELKADGGGQACTVGTVDDGCSADGVCFTTASGNTSCTGLPACSQDGGCPVGTRGATCNVRPDGGRLFPGKQRVCLVSFCDSNADCPAAFSRCVTGNGAAQTFCSNGLKGSSCLRPTDCNSNTCTGADAGLYGTCG
jgi:hypothetical protein